MRHNSILLESCKQGCVHGMGTFIMQCTVQYTEVVLGLIIIINPRRREGYSSRSVRLSVCLSVYDNSRTTGYEAA